MQNLHQLTSESLTQIWGMSCYKLQSWCIRRVANLSLVALISLLFLAFWPASKAKKILRMFLTGKEKVSNSISVLKWPTLSSYWSVILSFYMLWVWVSRSDHVELSRIWPRHEKTPNSSSGGPQTHDENPFKVFRKRVWIGRLNIFEILRIRGRGIRRKRVWGRVLVHTIILAKRYQSEEAPYWWKGGILFS